MTSSASWMDMRNDREYRSKGLRNSSKKRMTSHSISERSGENAVAAKAGKEMWSIDSMRRIRIPPYLYIPINPLLFTLFLHHLGSQVIFRHRGCTRPAKTLNRKTVLGISLVMALPNGEYWWVNDSWFTAPRLTLQSSGA
jgi:hypothetical protein